MRLRVRYALLLLLSLLVFDSCSIGRMICDVALTPKTVYYDIDKASDYCYKTYGWNFKEASAVEQVAKCDRPMLFIHGDSDKFVSVDFVYECYNAKTHGYKEIWVEPDTPQHALMYLKHTEEYTTHVIQFINTVKNMTKSHTVS